MTLAFEGLLPETKEIIFKMSPTSPLIKQLNYTECLTALIITKSKHLTVFSLLGGMFFGTTFHINVISHLLTYLLHGAESFLRS
jgi:hypothetical protein